MATHVLVDTDSTQTVDAKTLTGATISSPALSGTVTGTYTLGGTPTISAPTISAPSVTGILTVAGQVKFPGTANPSADVNTLDDYEEGTWTPSLGGNTTYSTQTGSYVKIGKLVWFTCTLLITTLGTGSTTTVSGLPFTSAVDTAVSVGPNATLAVSPVSLTPYVASGGTSIVSHGRTAGAASATSQAIFGNGAQITYTGSYII